MTRLRDDAPVARLLKARRRYDMPEFPVITRRSTLMIPPPLVRYPIPGLPHTPRALAATIPRYRAPRHASLWRMALAELRWWHWLWLALCVIVGGLCSASEVAWWGI